MKSEEGFLNVPTQTTLTVLHIKKQLKLDMQLAVMPDRDILILMKIKPVRLEIYEL